MLKFMRKYLLPLLAVFVILTSQNAMAVATPTTAQPAVVMPAAAPAKTLRCSTGGYSHSTDTFFITRKWNKEYGQYTYQMSWGGNRTVTSGKTKYAHRLESVRIKADGRNMLITRFNTPGAKNEVYWLNSSKAIFTMTVRITKTPPGTRSYRACNIIF